MLFYEFLIYFHFYVLFLKVLLKREIVLKLYGNTFNICSEWHFFPTFENIYINQFLILI